MTERPSLFRQEALEFQAAVPRYGGVLQIDPRWTRWLYWMLLALPLVVALVTATASTSETTSGPALINVQERSFVALVPGAASPDLHRGQLVRLEPNGPQGRPLAARLVTSEVADRAVVRRAGFASSSQPAVLVRGVLAPDADVASLASSPRHEGRAVVVLRSKRILSLFFGLLGGMLGGDGGS